MSEDLRCCKLHCKIQTLTTGFRTTIKFRCVSKEQNNLATNEDYIRLCLYETKTTTYLLFPSPSGLFSLIVLTCKTK